MKSIALSVAALGSLVSAAPAQKRGCGIGVCEFNSADSPKCWGNYSLQTNYYDDIPETGVTREYWFNLEEGNGAPDGFERHMMTINGSAPGPTIYANWGDWVVVHVKNNLANNGTSIHWHGIRQLLTSQEDGVASITQCPTAPGDSITYKWRASQYGHTWYHSHFALQAWNGVFGGIIINGPASAPYDEDKGILFLNDWFYNTTDQLWPLAHTPGLPPSAQNALINGTNVNAANTTGSRFETTFAPGSRHRLRIVNGALDSHFKFSIDDHSMTVIATDMVPIEPYTTNVLSVAIGQRYDIIVEADQDEGDYWMRANVDSSCSATNENLGNILGIVRYDSSSTTEPNTSGYDYTNDCLDESMDNLVPYLRLDAEAPSQEALYAVNLDPSTGVVHWTLNGTSFMSDWSVPTLEQAVDDVTVFETAQQVIVLDGKDEWVYLVIESALAIVSINCKPSGMQLIC